MFEDVVPPHRGGTAARRGVRLSTLILIRWGAIAGQAVTLLTVYHVLGFPVHLNSGLTVVGASVLLNLVLTALRPAGERPNEAALTALFGFDVVQLAVLLHLTGGLENPFSFLLLAPLTVSATILGPRSTALLGGLALTAITVLALDHAPLPWPRPGFALPDTYVMGAWVALALGIGFFAAYTWRVAEEARRGADEASGAGHGVCAAANDDAPGQVVVSGDAAAVERAVTLARERGARRAIVLDVSAPFHCPLMRPAADEMAEVLAEVPIAPPRVPVVANVSARGESDPETLRGLLIEQITKMVRWRESVEFMRDQGVETLVELGAGKVLTGLVRRIDRDLTGIAVGSPRDVEDVLRTF